MIGRFVAYSVVFLLTVVPASAQVMSREAIELRNQILEVQNQVNQLQRQVEANGARAGSGSALGGSYNAPSATRGSGGNDLVVNLLQQVSSLQDQVRDLRGKVDELTNSTDRKIADLDKKIGDLSFQLQLAQGKTGVAPNVPGSVPSAARPSAGAVPSSSRPSAAVLLERARTALGRSDYAGASAAATEVLQTDAHSPLAYQAQFVLARALYGQKQYSRAALAYDDAYGRAPAGQYAQDSLLGLARSLALINQKPAACAALAKLRKQFTALHPDVAQGAAALSQESRCS